MVPVARFEDLIAWQKARELAKQIYQRSSRGSIARDYALRNQVRRSAESVMSNLAEGFERGGQAEFHQFLSTAKASCAELRSQLYLLLDAGHLTQEQFDRIKPKAEEVARIVAALRTAVARQRDQERRVASSAGKS